MAEQIKVGRWSRWEVGSLTKFIIRLTQMFCARELLKGGNMTSTVGEYRGGGGKSGGNITLPKHTGGDPIHFPSDPHSTLGGPDNRYPSKHLDR